MATQCFFGVQPGTMGLLCPLNSPDWAVSHNASKPLHALLSASTTHVELHPQLDGMNVYLG